jgi:cation diffusion facilitator CzcD-associated flavoprotein CzcO
VPVYIRGIISYGFDVQVFERDHMPGGNWHYTKEVVPDKVSIPNAEASVGDYVPSLPPRGVELLDEQHYHSDKSEC